MNSSADETCSELCTNTTPLKSDDGYDSTSLEYPQVKDFFDKVSSGRIAPVVLLKR